MANKIECDNCGSLNPTSFDACELCGESLADELRRSKEPSTPMLIFMAVSVTVLFFGLPYLLLMFYFLWDWGTDPMSFTAGYFVAWGVGMAVGKYFEPKEHYDLGWDTRYGFVDRWFTWRDDVDRAHASLGMALFPMNVVRGTWGLVFRKLTGRE